MRNLKHRDTSDATVEGGWGFLGKAMVFGVALRFDNEDPYHFSLAEAERLGKALIREAAAVRVGVAKDKVVLKRRMAARKRRR